MMLSLKLISEKTTDMEVIPKIALLFTVRETRKVNNLVNNLDFKVGFYSSVIYCQEALIMLELVIGHFCGICTMCDVFDMQK